MDNIHEVHVSDVRSMRDCRRRWYWNRVLGYEPERPGRALSLGIAYHEGMAAFYEPKLWDTTNPQGKLDRALLAFNDALDSEIEQYKAAANINTLDVDTEQQYQESRSLGTEMLRYYAYKIHPFEDRWFRPLRTEITFAIPLRDPNNRPDLLTCPSGPLCGQNHEPGAPVYLVGTFDAIVEDINTGYYYIVDHKTAGQLYPNDDFLYLDDQIANYTAAAVEHLQLPVRGFIYAEYLKAVPKPPATLEKRNKGKILSVAKNQITDYDTYRQEILNVGDDPNDYADHLAWLQGPEAKKFHQRFTVVKEPEENASALHALSQQAYEMTRPDMQVYPAPNRRNCPTCAFKEPCKTANRQDDVQFTLDSLYRKVH